MKFEVNERGSREYYDEFLYITSQFRKYQKNPKRKTYRLSRYLTVYEVLALAVGALNAYFYWLNGYAIHLVMACLLGLMMVIYLRYLFNVNSRIKELMNDKGSKEVEINEEYIGFKDDSKDIRLKWEDICGAVKGRYGICFLPKDSTGILISISNFYKDKVLQGLKEAGKEYLITE